MQLTCTFMNAGGVGGAHDRPGDNRAVGDVAVDDDVPRSRTLPQVIPCLIVSYH